MSMNVCQVCSTVLASDGVNWKCPYELVNGQFKPHPLIPAKRDSRVSTLANQAFWKERR